MPIHWKTSKAIIIVLAVLGTILFFAFDLDGYVSVDSWENARRALAEFYSSHRVLTLVVFILIYIAMSALALPGPLVLSLAAGAVFGVVMGTVCVTIAATAGASLAFLAARYLFRDAIMRRFGPRLDAVNAQLKHEGFRQLLFLRLVPIFPFTLINLAAAITDMSFRTFVLATMLGIIPAGFVYCNAGAGLVAVTGIGDILTPRVMGSLLLLALFAIVPVVYRKVRRNLGSAKPP